jgi:hypothetical protein
MGGKGRRARALASRACELPPPPSPGPRPLPLRRARTATATLRAAGRPHRRLRAFRRAPPPRARRCSGRLVGAEGIERGDADAHLIGGRHVVEQLVELVARGGLGDEGESAGPGAQSAGDDATLTLEPGAGVQRGDHRANGPARAVRLELDELHLDQKPHLTTASLASRSPFGAKADVATASKGGRTPVVSRGTWRAGSKVCRGRGGRIYSRKFACTGDADAAHPRAAGAQTEWPFDAFQGASR